MTNITNAERIRNAVVNLFTGKLNDKSKAEEYTTKYLSDSVIDENEYQEISAEFGEDFTANIKSIAGEAPKDIEDVEGGNVNDYTKAIAIANGVESALNQANGAENWDKVIELLENATPEEIQAANIYFQIKFKDDYDGRDMIQEIASNYPDGSGDAKTAAIKGQREAFKLAMQGKTNVLDPDSLARAQKAIATFSDDADANSKTEFTKEEATKIADEVEAALTQANGAEDWDKVIELLEYLDDEQMQEVNLAYQLKYGKDHNGRDMIEEIGAQNLDNYDKRNGKQTAYNIALRGKIDAADKEGRARRNEILTAWGETPTDEIKDVTTSKTREDYSQAFDTAAKINEALNQPDGKEDWDTVISLLENLSAEEIQQINIAFKIEYGEDYRGRDMIQEIEANYLDGNTAMSKKQEAYNLAIKGKTDLDDPNSLAAADEMLAACDGYKDSHELTDLQAIEIATQIEEALALKDGKEDWAKVNEILDGLSDKQIQQVNIAYKLAYGDIHEGRDMIQEICANEIDDGDTKNQDLKNEAIMKAMRGQTDLTDAESIAYEQQIRNNSTSEQTSNGGNGAGSFGSDYTTYFENNSFVYDPKSPQTAVEQRYNAWINRVDNDWINAEMPEAIDFPESSGSSGTSGSGGSSGGSHTLKMDECEDAFKRAEKIHEGLNKDGGGKEDWGIVNKELKGLSNEEIQRVMLAYEIKYGKNLEQEVKDQENDHTDWLWLNPNHDDYEDGREEAQGYLVKGSGTAKGGTRKDLEDYWAGKEWE